MSKTVLNGLTAGYSKEYHGQTFFYYDNEFCGIKLRVKDKIIHSLGCYEEEKIEESKNIIKDIFKKHKLFYTEKGLVIKKGRKKYFFCLSKEDWNPESVQGDWDSENSKYLFVAIPEKNLEKLKCDVEEILRKEKLII